MKKTIAILLSAIMVISLCGCGSENTSTEQKEETNNVEAEVSTSETSKGHGVIDIDDIVVIDNDECAVLLTELDPADGAYTVKTELENKSSEKTYMFIVEYAAVNGIQTETYFGDEVTPGKKAIEDIMFLDKAIYSNDIGEFTDIEIGFQIYAEDDDYMDNAMYGSAHIYPYGKDQASTYARSSEETDKVLVDNEDILFVITGAEPDEYGGYQLNTYIENRTDEKLMFIAEDSSVNEYMADCYWGYSLEPGKVTFSPIYWESGTLEGIGITDVSDITEIKFNLNVYDYDSNTVFYEGFTVNP